MSRQFTEKDSIKNLQTYLRAQTLIYPNTLQVPVDGIFDSATKNALIDFQLRNSLEPTGIADRITHDLLYAQYLDITRNNALSNPIIPFPSYPQNYAIKSGDKSFLVAVLQYMINEIGVVYNTLPLLEINGEYDEETEQAIRLFQEINRLPPTSQTDRITWDALAKIYNLSMHYIEIN
jgi:peptidoglycan hydrolase-like protein with peptidoglycan-binding domain